MEKPQDREIAPITTVTSLHFISCGLWGALSTHTQALSQGKWERCINKTLA